MSAHKTTPFADSWLPLRTCGLKRHEEEAAVRVKDETPFLTHLMDFYRERYISATIFSVADLFHRFKFRILSVLLLFHYYGPQVPTVSTWSVYLSFSLPSVCVSEVIVLVVPVFSSFHSVFIPYLPLNLLEISLCSHLAFGKPFLE